MVEAILDVWSAISGWFVDLFPKITAFFYTPGVGDAPGSLTFMGVFAVVMAGVSLILLVFNLIRSFLPMRG